MKKGFYSMLFVDIYKKYFNSFLFFGVFTFIAFQTLPNLIFWPSVGLDPSWVVGLNIASIENMQFGKDIIFTFGPLGFLYLPAFINFDIWIISLSFALFVHFLLLYSIFSIVKKLPLNFLDYVVMAIILIFAIPMTSIDFKLLFSVMALFYLSITDESFSKYRLLINTLICLLLAVASLLKFTCTVISFSILLLMVVYYLYRRKFIYLPLILSIYIGSLLFLLYMTGQSISNLPAYLLNSLEISRGYNTAMSISGPDIHDWLGFCVIGLISFILIDSILKKKPNLIYYIILNAGFIFVSFKYGYVRHDGHVFYFFSNMLLILMITAFTLKAESRKILQHASFVFICVLIGLIYHQFPDLLKPQFAERYRNACSALSIIRSNDQERDEIIKNNKENMKKIYALDVDTLDFINHKTMDMFPWEISLAYAYDLNWSPRPIIQSYSAYTQKLDTLNSEYIEKDTSPEILFYGLETIDYRYHLFDTPKTFRTILSNYQPVLIDKGYLLLQKSNKSFLATPEKIYSINVKIGDSIPVPKIDEGFVFANVYLDYNFAGKIFNILYKVPYAMILIKSGEKEYNHRFIFSTAQNGIFLSQYITNVEELMQIWNNKPLNNMDSFTISVGNKIFYNKNIHVEFFQIKPVKSVFSSTDNKSNSF